VEGAVAAVEGDAAATMIFVSIMLLKKHFNLKVKMLD
jgi:hypothetical protein